MFLALNIAKIAQISEIPSNSLIFLSRWKHHDGVVLLRLVVEEVDRRIAGFLLVIT